MDDKDQNVTTSLERDDVNYIKEKLNNIEYELRDMKMWFIGYSFTVLATIVIILCEIKWGW